MQIVDVDFRYVTREQATPGHEEPHKMTFRKVPVLQWRKMVPMRDAPGISKWTDWQDVRAEDE